MPEYSVYELTADTTQLDEQPGNSPLSNRIGTVEAPGLEQAYDVAVSEYGSPIAVE